MGRRHYLVSYDVADDKRRDRIFKALRDHGNHAQYSVFLCELDRRELATLRAALLDIVHNHEDQVLILDLGPNDAPLDLCLSVLGKPYRPPGRTLVV